LSKIGKPRSSKGLAVFCARIAEGKLAHDTIILNLTNIETSPSDFFVLCTCDSDVQMKAVANDILRQCKDTGIDKPGIEGLDGGFWILLDFFDVVMHIMIKDARKFYKLEKLWGDAKFLKLNEEGKPVTLTPAEIKAFTRN
jgi:ribosome-associated protein